MIGVIGATRFIGKFVVDELIRAAESVTWFVRDPERASGLVHRDVQIRVCDLEKIPDRLPQVDRVVCVAPIRMADAVIEFCESVGARRAVFLSSTWRYSRYRTAQVEDVVRGEETVMASDLVWTILRPTMIYGPGDRNVSVLRTHIVGSRLLPVIGSGECLVQPVFVEDLAVAISSAVSRRSIHYKCFDVCGPDAMTFSKMLDEIASDVDRHPFKIYIPLFAARAIAWGLEKFTANPWITLDRVRRMSEDRNFDIRETTEGLGTFPCSFAEGLKRAAALE